MFTLVSTCTKLRANHAIFIFTLYFSEIIILLKCDPHPENLKNVTFFDFKPQAINCIIKV